MYYVTQWSSLSDNGYRFLVVSGSRTNHVFGQVLSTLLAFQSDLVRLIVIGYTRLFCLDIRSWIPPWVEQSKAEGVAQVDTCEEKRTS